jgi:hypothetical protein
LLKSCAIEQDAGLIGLLYEPKRGDDEAMPLAEEGAAGEPVGSQTAK